MASELFQRTLLYAVLIIWLRTDCIFASQIEAEIEVLSKSTCVDAMVVFNAFSWISKNKRILSKQVPETIPKTQIDTGTV